MVDGTSFPWLGDTTDSAGALQHLTQVLDDDVIRNNTQKMALYVSDGHSSDRQGAFEAATRAHEDDVTVLTVGADIKGRMAEEELDGITSNPDSLNRFAFDKSCSYVTDVLEVICNG